MINIFISSTQIYTAGYSCPLSIRCIYPGSTEDRVYIDTVGTRIHICLIERSLDSFSISAGNSVQWWRRDIKQEYRENFFSICEDASNHSNYAAFCYGIYFKYN